MSADTKKVAHFSSEYALSLLGSLHAQQKAGEFCDIILQVDSLKFQCHKNVLAAASPYFHAMFTGGLCEADRSEIDIHGTSKGTFEMLLKFMYTGDIEITEDCCQDLLSAADLFGLSSILEACCEFLQRQLHPSNCLGIYQLAEAHCCEDLRRYTEDYICKHFLDLLREEEFPGLCKHLLIKFLTNENLRIDKEIQVLNAALQWINHDLSKRRILVFELMNCVRFPLISKSSLIKNIEDCSDLGLKIAVRKISQDYDESNRKSQKIEKLRKIQPYLFQSRKGSLRNIVVVGGYKKDEGSKWSDAFALSSVEMFDTYQMTWKAASPLKYGRSSHATVVLDGLIYVLGGERDSLIYDTVECYDPVTNDWTVRPCMSLPRSGLGAAVIEDHIYVLGGWVGSVISATIEKFEPHSNSWRFGGRMVLPRASLGVVAHEGLIYIVGGETETNRELASLESYNPVTNEWCHLASMWTARINPGVCLGDDCLYVIGGYNEDDAAISSIERYDFEKNKWKVLTEMQTPRLGASVVCLNHMLYVIGGRYTGIASYTVDSVECYDLDADCWLSVDSLNTGRCDAGVVIL